jgi:hypothetical protein
MDDIHYLNVDLEIKSRTDLSILVDGFGENVAVMYNGVWDTFFLASFESFNNDGVNENIKSFCRLVESLEDEAKKLWDGSHSKIFDIGFQSGMTPQNYNTELEASTLEDIIKIGASIAITIYPIETEPANIKLFTLIILYKGGSYISQVEENDFTKVPIKGIENWDISDIYEEISERDKKEIVKQLKSELFVPITSTKNVWCGCVEIHQNLMEINIIETKINEVST